MLSAAFFEHVISYDGADGTADDETDDDTAHDCTAFSFFCAFPKWPHTSAV